MYIHIAVLKETQPLERRVAMTPSVAAKLEKLGGKLHMEAGAGEAANFSDAAYSKVTLETDPVEMVRLADVVLSVQAPSAEIISAMQEGAVLISFIYAQKQPELVKLLVSGGITCFAMERVPRISRAQSLDALSSQAALAGYYSVQTGSTHMRRILPKLTTAAGTIGPAKVLVMGLGVAGLEALAMAHRLGAEVEGYDVRPETKEQAESIGAKFIDTGVDATGKGGYARELSVDEKAKVAEVLTNHIQTADLVITTAAIPGKPSPKLIDEAQVKGMKAGAVIVDLAAEGGGNCAASIAGETIQVGHITILAPLNVPSEVAEDASTLYANNQYNLLVLIMKENVIHLDWDDEVISQTCLTHDGARKDAPAKPPTKPGA